MIEPTMLPTYVCDFDRENRWHALESERPPMDETTWLLESADGYPIEMSGVKLECFCTHFPSQQPTEQPTIDPTAFPTEIPSVDPTELPSEDPTEGPSAQPTHLKNV